MIRSLNKFQAMIQKPLGFGVRGLLLLSLASLVLVVEFPLWTMAFQSNQYPDPLRLSIYIDHLEGQKTASRDDLREINSLNHYIGMRPLLESEFSEFLWLPFLIGFFALIVLRAVVLGNIRNLIDINILYLYFGLFSAWNFYNRLYQYGHNLDPEAAIKVTPFTPPFFGRVQIANFSVESYPGPGSYGLLIFGVLLLAALAISFRERPGSRSGEPGSGVSE